MGLAEDNSLCLARWLWRFLASAAIWRVISGQCSCQPWLRCGFAGAGDRWLCVQQTAIKTASDGFTADWSVTVARLNGIWPAITDRANRLACQCSVQRQLVLWNMPPGLLIDRPSLNI
jgi:hypothetical protein